MAMLSKEERRKDGTEEMSGMKVESWWRANYYG